MCELDDFFHHSKVYAEISICIRLAHQLEKNVQDDKAGDGGPQTRGKAEERTLTEVGPQVHTAEHLDSQIVIHFS
jgi:hypothetical protein